MNCKNLHLILSFLAFSFLVTSSPINKKVVKIGKCKTSEDKATANVNTNDICNTPECKTIAEDILNSINEDIDPCDNFYEFACGNWIKSHEIPPDQTAIGSMSNINKENINMIIEILNGEYKPNESLTEEQQKVDKDNFTQIQNLFKSCMDTDAIDAKGIEPLVKLLKELNINNKDVDYTEDKYLTDLLVKLRSYGSAVFFDYMIESDIRYSSRKAFYIYQSGMGLTREFYEYEEVVPIYKKTIHDMFANIFNEKSEEEIEKITASVYDLEEKIAKISLTGQGRFNIETISEAYPYIDWKAFFTNIFEKFNINKEFNNDITIIDVTSSYFEKLGDILKNTDNETLTAFAEWIIIRQYSDIISNEYKAPLKEITKVLTGIEDDIERNEYCINSILGSYMGMATGKLFIEKGFVGNSKEIAESIIDNIKEAMVKRIPNMTWLDEPTAEYAVNKTLAINKMIGFPDYITDPIELAKDYEGLKSFGDDFFTNIMNLITFNIGDNLKSFFEPIKSDDWVMAPQTVNAYYQPLNNQIVFPAGILQKPIFNYHSPSYLNYGVFGAVAGHELTHAFDNNGKKYTIEGNYENWWTDSTNEEFNELTQCFVDEYSSFSIEDENGVKHYVNGTSTLAENLADNGGVDRAYEAWKISIEKDVNAKENNKLLPGLTKYTQDQLFFIAYGQFWCTKPRPEIAANYINEEVHSPPIYRVNGVAYNSQRFAKIFNCPTNSPMNPEKKCVIW
ncbi:zincin [Anaeromyces robustus]|uniref:Zincin n=1 Tax=Anaeromyces robustus TaxID=1754192 RepID=A0A1Y1W3N4_9FUNG|nr:zincin [Anaeromyces robustus]|eukprot:ORX68078.1 zincin [Anaeromyces robustus]